MIVIDNFLESFKELSTTSKTIAFERKVNDVDGAVYPAISFDIPEYIKKEFKRNIEESKGFKIDVNLMFLRANPKGESEPYQAHNDLNMGAYTCILYITEIGGTSFLSHKATGFKENDPSRLNEWLNDCNSFDEWNIDEHCQAKENRALFFDAERMHRGEPVSGHGKGSNSRMIMVCFFNKADDDS
jgi:hypothetical protein